jgi:hypothetical protein
MANESKTLIQGEAIRVTKVDECGEVVVGECGYAVEVCFASVAMSDNVENPAEYKVKAASGDFCVNQRGRPQLNWIDVVVTLLRVNPELVSLMTGLPVIYDDSPDPVAIGFGTDSDTYATGYFALETWTNLAVNPDGAACNAAGARYGYLLLPWLGDATLGDITIEDGAANIVLNAVTKGGNQWGTGPWDVLVDSGDDPSPLLEALPSTRHRHLQFTSLAPPAATDGCQFLDAVS